MVVRAFLSLILLLAAYPSLASDPAAFNRLAKSAQEAQNADRLVESINLYHQALSLKPTWSDGWWSLGSILYDQDRFPEAEDAFQKFVSLNVKPGPGYAFLGLCEYETSKYDDALRHFRLWASGGWSGTPQLIDVSLFHFALLLTRDGKFVQALYLLAAEVSKSHSGPMLVEAMGLASLRMKNVPEDYPPERREEVWLAGETAFYAAVHPADFRRADEYANRLSAHYDQSANVHYFLGTLRRFESNDDEAEKEYERELKVSPQHVAAMIELAKLDLEDDRLDQALSLAKNASQIEPQNAEAHGTLGEALVKSSSFEGAAHELEIAKQLAPDSAPIRFQLATAYRKLRRAKDADREMAVFNSLKDKEMVSLAPVQQGNQPEAVK